MRSPSQNSFLNSVKVLLENEGPTKNFRLPQKLRSDDFGVDIHVLSCHLIKPEAQKRSYWTIVSTHTKVLPRRLKAEALFQPQIILSAAADASQLPEHFRTNHSFCRAQEVTDDFCNLIRLCIESKVTGFQHVHFRARHILVVAFRFAGIK